ncbi:MAG: S8 family serine peptidase [Chloroflexi bacterium]|nr:S8 family serine peptidase [Chloroflexota bacterium]
MKTQTIMRHLINVASRSAIFVALMLGLVHASPVGVVAAEGGGFRAGEIVIKLNPLAGATVDDINATYQTTTLKSLAPADGIYLLQTPPGKDAQILAETIELDLRLSFVELNFLGQAPEADPRGISRWGGMDAAPYSSQYAADLLGLAQAQVISRGAGVVVAVIDTGAQLDHPALAASFTAARHDFIDGDDVPDDVFSGLDGDGDGVADEAAGHGTHVAGIVHLVAPEAQIMPLRVLDTDGNGDVFTVAEAIMYAIHNGANVINLSLGTPSKSDMLKEVIRTATRNGVVVVAAAGNLNSKEPQYPAANECALSVTAVGPGSIKSDFANFSGGVDFAAPGESIYSTFPKDGYAWWSGTSMAAPFVAGQAALIHSAAPGLNVREIALLMGGVAHSLDKLNPQFDGQLGQGQADIGASLERLFTNPLPASNRGLMGLSCVQ